MSSIPTIASDVLKRLVSRTCFRVHLWLFHSFLIVLATSGMSVAREGMTQLQPGKIYCGSVERYATPAEVRHWPFMMIAKDTADLFSERGAETIARYAEGFESISKSQLDVPEAFAFVKIFKSSINERSYGEFLVHVPKATRPIAQGDLVSIQRPTTGPHLLPHVHEKLSANGRSNDSVWRTVLWTSSISDSTCAELSKAPKPIPENNKQRASSPDHRDLQDFRAIYSRYSRTKEALNRIGANVSGDWPVFCTAHYAQRRYDRLNECLSIYRDIYKSLPTTSPHHQLIALLEANIAIDTGDYTRAINLATRLRVLVVASARSGRKSDAAKYLEELENTSAETNYARGYKAALLAQAYLSMGRHESAIQALTGDWYKARTNAWGGLMLLGVAAVTVVDKAYVPLPETVKEWALGSTEKLLVGVGLAERPADEIAFERAFIVLHALVELGRFKDARAHFDSASSVWPRGSAASSDQLQWGFQYELGRLLQAEGRNEEAEAAFKRAIEFIERSRNSLTTEGSRIGFFGDKQAVYQSLVGLYFDSGKHDQAFLMGERSKSRALVDMLANKQDFHLPVEHSRKVEQLLASSQIGEVRLNWTVTDEAAAIEFARRTVKTDRDRSDVDFVKGELETLKRNAKEQLTTQYAELASLVSVPKVSLAEITHALPADETLVSYYYDAKNLYAFVIDKSGLKAVKLNREGLEDEVQTLRQAIQKRGAYQQPAKALHDRLIAPLTDKITQKKLLIAGHGVMHYLPFAALSNGQHFLIERYQLAFLPSASTIKFVGNIATQNKPGVLLAFGNPDLGDKEYDLTFAEKEAKEVGGLFSSSKVFLRKDASKQNLKEYGTGFRYLHFATHGKFEATNPLGSSLLLASNSVDNLADRLTIGELYSMRLDADLVTLSACETGLGDIANGDDVVGLVRGFLYAGANQVISTLWEIDDAATSQLMTDFYRQIKDGKTSKGTALRNSQLAAAKTYPHPYFWAAFQITGGAKEAKKL